MENKIKAIFEKNTYITVESILEAEEGFIVECSAIRIFIDDILDINESLKLLNLKASSIYNNDNNIAFVVYKQ